MGVGRDLTRRDFSSWRLQSVSGDHDRQQVSGAEDGDAKVNAAPAGALLQRRPDLGRREFLKTF
jgi:hypothetical protein